MFYSQFILAKKGPLGTIWIAAHLERKLRKNQVADTDIGVSVDSIIFPEVPIALRLSSHLLLGVVRIYSRKVNYLFDDCSEALLKIKQAFRSTAVDLPPEESTAPYHSITLPETFDLDDFELPDHDIFQGNYIDHHISNKEQITLQDTMDGLDYSTSKFGLDERFGDGDTSQIGLDLDQDLLLNILPAPENARDDMDLDDVPNTSSHPDESIMNENNGKTSESAEAIQAKPSGPEDGAVIQSSTVDNGINELLEYAQAPATPGLVEEPNLSNQKTLACDDRFESKNNLIETVTHENPTETLHSSPPGEDMVVNHDPKAVYTENGHMSSEPKIKQSELESNSNLGTQDAALGVIKKPQGKYCEDVTCQSEEPLSPNNVLTSSGLGSLDGSDCLQVLHACNSDVKVHDTLSKGKENAFLDQPSECPTPFDKGEDVQGDSVKVQGNFQVTDTTIESVDVMNQSADKCQQVQENYSGLNEKIESSFTKHDDEVSFAPPVSELPAAEKLRSVPERHSELPTDLLPDTTPEKVVSAIDEDGTGVTTRQKRSFTESTLTIDSLHTAESSGKNRLRKTAESVPGDEDLLSSILVGRRSSILNLKPTPTQTEVVSMKRPQTASRSITYKRKVLMDDTMVLHGDTIREQLVSTEDIRRVRKKAPCTRQEFWMIQKQFLEEDIVYDPISTGMSIDLVCLHNQAYELSGISITRVDESVNLTGSTQEMQPPWDKSVIPNAQEGGIEETNVETQLGTTSFQIENQPGEGDTSCVSHDNSELQKGEYAASVPLATSLEQAHISEMEVDGDSGAVVEAAEHSSYLPIESSSPACVIPVDTTEIAVGCAIPLAGETSYCSNVNYEASSLNQSNKEKVDHSHVATVDAGDGSPLHVKSVTLTELSSKEADNSGCVDDIELFESLTAPEAHGHDLVHGADTQALDNYGSNEAGPSLSVVHYVNIKKLSPIGGQNDIFNEFDEPRRIANGTTDAGSAVVEDYNGTNYITAEHDTGFLNVDDDQEEDESYMPSIEETRSRIADNSGWSSRSRAVGKYLQIMFDKEAEQGKNVIPMDNLLTGKSRKEASRMFFETLVLKTRDYIQLEQTGPFNNINMHPKLTLMKSDF